MHAQWRCEKNVLAAAKRGVVVLCSVISLIYDMQVYVCRYRGNPDTRNFVDDSLITPIRFLNNDMYDASSG